MEEKSLMYIVLDKRGGSDLVAMFEYISLLGSLAGQGSGVEVWVKSDWIISKSFPSCELCAPSSGVFILSSCSRAERGPGCPWLEKSPSQVPAF